MLNDYKDTLYIFSCAATGKKVTQKTNIKLHILIKICMSNGIWPTVFTLIKDTLPNVPEVNNIKADTVNRIYNHMSRILNVSKIVELLENNGVHCCMLKGPTISSLYADPYSRISTDTDIYIKENVERACDILAENGFEIQDKWVGSHHIKCTRNDCGMIELHTSCFEKEIEDLWFDGANFFEFDFVPYEFEGIKCQALNPTEGFLFNLLHFIKHYISGMISARHIMDCLLFLKAHKNEIDYKKLDEVLTKLNYTKFLKVCIAFGIEYLQFESDDFSYIINEDLSEETELLLQDLYASSLVDNAGIDKEYGEHTFKEKNKKGNYESYSRKKNNGSFLKMAKVKGSVMEEKYPILVKYKFLYPIFYVHRAVLGLYKRLFTKPVSNDTRLELIKKLGL